MGYSPEYHLPFDGIEHPVSISQGRNGPWSHFRRGAYDLSNAVDFALPIGSEILSAREGIVLMHYDQGDEYYEGVDPEVGNNLRFMTNQILILHDDGTRALYSHLEKGSVCVRPREPVASGQKIAETGLSGWIGDVPHLHFQVANENFRESLPVEFVEYEGPLEHGELFAAPLAYSRVLIDTTVN